jgi:hypothetical protein
VDEGMTMKIINAFPGMGESMTEEETKNFMVDNDNTLLIRIGIFDYLVLYYR